MVDRVNPRIVPGSIHDERSDAFGEVMRKALAEPEFKTLLFERIDDVDARVLPFLIRSFNVQHFIEPGMTDAIIRRIIKGSFELHRQKAFIYGVRTGLAMLGISVTGWSQWFQQHPAGAPGTHIATLSVGEEVFVDEGRAITARLQRAIVRNVSRMQRKSQHIALRISTAGTGSGGPGAPGGGIGDMESVAPVHVGAQITSRLRISPSTEPTTYLSARPPLFAAAVVTSRLRIAPRIA
jgi:phage tail P2-like protein